MTAHAPGAPVAPLAGVRVVDLSWLLPGPFATMILAELGADVIKIERPEGGDYLREMFPGAFALCNRGKRSVVLDLKSDPGRRDFKRLLDTADVMIEGFRPGVAENLGIDYATLAPHHPRLVYASVTGYGRDGPMALRPGHDVNYLAFAGAMGIPGHWNEEPRRSGLPVGDLAAGLYAVIDILAALRERDRTGRGRQLDVAIAEAVLHWSEVRFADLDSAGEAATSGPWRHLHPGNDVYRTADGRLLSLGLVESKFWLNFCRAAGRADLEALVAARDREGMRRLHDTIGAVVATRSLDEWERLLLQHDVPFAPVNGPAEAFGAAHLAHRGVVGETTRADGTRVRCTALPGWRPPAPSWLAPAPALGADTQEVLRELAQRSERGRL